MMRRISSVALALVLALATAPVASASHDDVVERSSPHFGGWRLSDIESALVPAELDAYSTGLSLESGWPGDPAQVAMAGAIGVPTEDLVVLQAEAADDRDVWFISVQGFSSDGAGPVAMLDGILAWQAVDRARHFDAVPSNEETEVGGKSPMRTTFPIDAGSEPYRYDPRIDLRDEADRGDAEPGTFNTGIDLTEDAVRYIHVSGDSAIVVTALDDEIATRFLERIP